MRMLRSHKADLSAKRYLKEYHHPSHTYLKQRVPGEADYARGIRSLVYGLWRGELDEFTFIDTMVFAVQRGMSRAWLAGAIKCAGDALSLTQTATRARDDLIASQFPYLVGFGEDIMKAQRDSGGKLTPLLRRAELWVGRYREAYFHGMQMACADSQLEWVMNPLKEHCPDCLSLNGQVMSGSEWQARHLWPRHRSLACKGYNCGCEFRKVRPK